MYILIIGGVYRACRVVVLRTLSARNNWRVDIIVEESMCLCSSALYCWCGMERLERICCFGCVVFSWLCCRVWYIHIILSTVYVSVCRMTSKPRGLRTSWYLFRSRPIPLTVRMHIDSTINNNVFNRYSVKTNGTVGFASWHNNMYKVNASRLPLHTTTTTTTMLLHYCTVLLYWT